MNSPFNITSADSSASIQINKNGRGAKIDIDLCQHTVTEISTPSRDEKTDLSNWQSTVEGKRATSDTRSHHFKSKKRDRIVTDKNNEN